MKLQHLISLLRHFGLKWIISRLLYAIRTRAGFFCILMPVKPWSGYHFTDLISESTLKQPDNYLHYRLKDAPKFFFSPDCVETFRAYFEAWDTPKNSPQTDADNIQDGVLKYFGHKIAHIGFPPNWFLNPFSKKKIPSEGHWSLYPDFKYGDIKIIWEPNRFNFVFTLVRAYWRTGDEKYAKAFWRSIEDWYDSNPPQQGPNWKCGQEISFRIMAWSFGLYGFLNSASTTAERVTLLSKMIAVSGERIEANLSYAISQDNNHGISEGVGLWTVGILFPEFKASKRWCELGRRVLEESSQKLIYDDGSFTQQSFNYHRLMLHDYLWSIRLGDLNGKPLSQELRERVDKASDFLYQIQDEYSGRMPNYGSNDGSLILPLNNCDYSDFRPVVQSTHYLNSKNRCYDVGAWDEDLLWFFGTDAIDAPLRPSERRNLSARIGGYYTLRAAKGFLFTRCATHISRPGSADMLHIDLWWKGQNIAIDAGTFSYNAPIPWNRALTGTAFHNTVSVDGLDQMDRVSKFVWLPWLKSKVIANAQSKTGLLHYMEGEHNGYQRLNSAVRHKRGVLRIDDEYWLILDRLASDGEHQYRLHWLLEDFPYTWDEEKRYLTLRTTGGVYFFQMHAFPGLDHCSLMRADAHSPRGWQAPYYNCRKPALSVETFAEAKDLLFVSIFSPEHCSLHVENEILQLETAHWEGKIALSDSNYEQSLVRRVTLERSRQDSLDVLNAHSVNTPNVQHPR